MVAADVASAARLDDSETVMEELAAELLRARTELKTLRVETESRGCSPCEATGSSR